MKKQKNILIDGAENKPITLDLFYQQSVEQPLVIYAHGFNGFKDWGNFDLIAEQFADAGFCFLKFNFSHNGTTPATPEEFTDLEAYGHNNYTKELSDLQQVIDWALSKENPALHCIDQHKVFLIGHSRGGGIVLLKAAEEKRVTSVATWASVAACKTPWGNWTDDRIAQWKKTGVEFYTNSRTGQQMPIYYQLHEDYSANSERLDVLKAVAHLTIPLLICHGTNDEAVTVDQAYQLKEASQQGELFLVDSDHVFGRRHPWTAFHLPEAMQQVVDKTISFFKSIQ